MTHVRISKQHIGMRCAWHGHDGILYQAKIIDVLRYGAIVKLEYDITRNFLPETIHALVSKPFQNRIELFDWAHA